jgi:PEGA domain
MMTFRKSVLVVAVCAALPCVGQDAGRRTELQESLGARYKLTVLGGGAMGIRGENSIRKAGGTVVVLRDGLFGSFDRKRIAANAVQDSKVTVVSGDKDVEVGRGEKFYVTAVYVGSDVVTVGLLSARNISGKAKSEQVWCTVNFFLPGEALAQGDIAKVDAVLDEWILPEGGVSAPVPPKTALAATVAAPPSAKAAELNVGMTREEVVGALGTPQQEVAFGEQRWLTYPGITATLQQGKLASVDRNAQALASVSVSSEPAGADVLLDGSFVSSTPAVLRLQGGTFKVVVKMPGYAEWERELKILPGAEVRLDAKLSK